MLDLRFGEFDELADGFGLLVRFEQFELDFEVADVENVLAETLLLLLHDDLDLFVLLLKQLAELQVGVGEHEEAFVELDVQDIDQFETQLVFD